MPRPTTALTFAASVLAPALAGGVGSGAAAGPI